MRSRMCDEIAEGLAPCGDNQTKGLLHLDDKGPDGFASGLLHLDFGGSLLCLQTRPKAEVQSPDATAASVPVMRLDQQDHLRAFKLSEPAGAALLRTGPFE